MFSKNNNRMKNNYLILSTLIFSLMFSNIFADVYMHNPRGSNDRNCERNANRNNGDRLFDSQNNNAGGYACQRMVGGENMTNEDGNFTWTDPTTGQSHTQTLRMYYYEGSILPIEFTNQHGCGANSKVNCEVVMQYACEDTLDPQVDNFFPWTAGKNGVTNVGKQHYRSGANIAAPRDGVPIDENDAATDTIGESDADATPNTTTTRRFGMHENYDYYTACKQTERNKGLYTADQQVNRNDRRGTRQNPNGNRRGLECPEERDYYPWWAPSPWIDIAVLSDSAADVPCYRTSTSCTTRCAYYQANTMNYHGKGYCDVDHAKNQPVSAKLTSTAWTSNSWYNNKAACLATNFSWYEVSHSDNLIFNGNDSFVCAKTQYSRVNQLGNARQDLIVSGDAPLNQAKDAVHTTVSKGVFANRFVWQVPHIPTPRTSSYFSSGMAFAYKACTLRLRYNISTADFQGWPAGAVNPGVAPMVTHLNNTRPNGQTSFTPLKQNPYIIIGPGDTATDGVEFVKLKVNTNQFGRTFQDRSYVFTIKPAPTTATAVGTNARVEANPMLDTPLVNNAMIANALANGHKIYNLNVRGKRGNIVQVYPSVEYDFIPNQLALNVNDMIHFQWIGSDYNPRRGCNDGTGGPPDPNTFNTDANTNQNSRADRHNFMLTPFLDKYTPSDYAGYKTNNNSIYYNQQVALQATQLAHLGPCGSDNAVEKADCVAQLKRLAFLNQQSDGMSLFLRQNANCLTITQLNAIGNADQADNNPLNCAKLNAKPSPYFDGGVMAMLTAKLFTYFDSRNNNFSNRMNKGVICIGSDCNLQNGTNVLQDVNPGINGNMITSSGAPVSPALVSGANQVDSPCASTSMTAGAGANGVQSCIAATPAIITGTTFAGNEGDNDNKGDGTGPAGCAQLTYAANSVIGVNTVEQQVVLAVVLFFVGLFIAWVAYYMYNRYRARTAGVSKFRYDATWQKTDNTSLSAADTNVAPHRVSSARPSAESSALQLSTKKNSEFI